MDPNNPPAAPSRRHFLGQSLAAAAASAALPSLGRAAESGTSANATANTNTATATATDAPPAPAPGSVYGSNGEKLRIGLVGCGGRGTGAANQALTADSNVELVAVGDLFADRLQSSLDTLRKQLGPKVNVAPEHCFVGFDAYKKVIDAGVDVVILTTPPAFRPVHLRAAVEAGKHVFAEKPVAVDAPGCRSALESAKIAKQKNLAFVAGFCWRYNGPERALFEQVHGGAIGDVTTSYHTYNTGYLWSRIRQPEWTDVEYQLRNWLYYTYLSGDHIVEQAVHSIDKLGWTHKDMPALRATGHGGRQVRTDPIYGNIFDHFAVEYDFADGSRGFLFCRQIDNCSNDVSDHIHGTRGIAHIDTGGTRQITPFGTGPDAAKAWKYSGPKTAPSMYQIEHNELFASIRAGKPINDGPRMVNSTMLAILGRMAAYTGQTVTWEQAWNSKEALTPEKWAFGPTPTPAVPMPGKTKLV